MTLRKVVLGMGAGVASTVTALGLTFLFQPFDSLFKISSAPWKITSLAALLPTLGLVICIARLAAHRFTTPEDLEGSGLTTGTAKAKLLQALLQNTLEQAAIALPVYAAWSIWAPARLVGMVLTASILFLCGRVLFFSGYHRGASGRALGFVLTFYPTVALLGSLLILLVRTFAKDLH
jgi:hypothetical protein